MITIDKKRGESLCFSGDLTDTGVKVTDEVLVYQLRNLQGIVSIEESLTVMDGKYVGGIDTSKLLGRYTMRFAVVNPESGERAYSDDVLTLNISR